MSKNEDIRNDKRWSSELLNFQNIKLELSAMNMEDSVFEMVNLLSQNGFVDEYNSKKLIRKFIKAEDKATTGLGGVATPYVSTDLVSDIILAVGISAKGIDFNAVDEEPVYVVLMIVVPERNIKSMAEILCCVKSFLYRKKVRDSLINAKNPEDVVELLRLPPICHSNSFDEI